MISLYQDDDDMFCRYTMPPVLVVKRGAGNGKRTALVNVDDIGKSLKRSLEELVTYIAVASNTAVNKTQCAPELKGWHECAQIQACVYAYITEFVLCRKCNNPETTYITSSKKLKLNCTACGRVKTVKPVSNAGEKLLKKLLKKLVKHVKPSKTSKTKT